MKRNITERDLKEIAEKFGYDQIVIIARRGGSLAGPDDTNCYQSHGIDNAPWWLSKLRKELFKKYF